MRGFAIGILAGLVLASAGVASARQGRGLGPSPEVVSQVTDEPELTDACAEESEESEESDGQCPAVEEEEESDQEPAPVTESGDRQASCEEAAGLSDDLPDLTTSEEGEDGSEEKVKGLDHALEVVLANCIKNPQAPGLLSALRHLAANRERKAAHDEAKAERKAAHAASKGHGKGH
jgi:hypothetical protein